MSIRNRGLVEEAQAGVEDLQMMALGEVGVEEEEEEQHHQHLALGEAEAEEEEQQHHQNLASEEAAEGGEEVRCQGQAEEGLAEHWAVAKGGLLRVRLVSSGEAAEVPWSERRHPGEVVAVGPAHGSVYWVPEFADQRRLAVHGTYCSGLHSPSVSWQVSEAEGGREQQQQQREQGQRELAAFSLEHVAQTCQRREEQAEH